MHSGCPSLFPLPPESEAWGCSGPSQNREGEGGTMLSAAMALASRRLTRQGRRPGISPRIIDICSLLRSFLGRLFSQEPSCVANIRERQREAGFGNHLTPCTWTGLQEDILEPYEVNKVEIPWFEKISARGSVS